MEKLDSKKMMILDNIQISLKKIEDYEKEEHLKKNAQRFVHRIQKREQE